MLHRRTMTYAFKIKNYQAAIYARYLPVRMLFDGLLLSSWLVMCLTETLQEMTTVSANESKQLHRRLSVDLAAMAVMVQKWQR